MATPLPQPSIPTETSHGERRESSRQPTRLLRTYSPFPSVIRDLGRDGMCLERVGEVEVGSCHVFRIRQGTLFFSVKGEIRWCLPHGSYSTSNGGQCQLFLCGVRFEEGLTSAVEEFLVG